MGSPGSSWRRVGETQTRRRAWSSFLPGVGWSGGHEKRQYEESWSPALPPPCRSKAGSSRGKRKVQALALAVTFLGDVLPHPRVLADRKNGDLGAPQGGTSIPPMGLWIPQGLLAGMVRARSLLPAPRPPRPLPRGPAPLLALLKNEESDVSAPSTASSSRKLG